MLTKAILNTTSCVHIVVLVMTLFFYEIINKKNAFCNIYCVFFIIIYLITYDKLNDCDIHFTFWHFTLLYHSDDFYCFLLMSWWRPYFFEPAYHMHGRQSDVAVWASIIFYYWTVLTESGALPLVSDLICSSLTDHVVCTVKIILHRVLLWETQKSEMWNPRIKCL